MWKQRGLYEVYICKYHMEEQIVKQSFCLMEKLEMERYEESEKNPDEESSPKNWGFSWTYHEQLDQCIPEDRKFSWTYHEPSEQSRKYHLILYEYFYTCILWLITMLYISFYYTDRHFEHDIDKSK